MLAKIEQLLQEIEGLHAANAEELEALRIKYLSKKGAINELMADFRNVPADQKKEVGMKLNELKNKAQERISTLKEAFETQDNGAAEMDLTRTAYPIELGTRHPLSIVKNEIIDIFHRLGFSIADGPEIEDDWHVFSSMNFAEDHPARDMQDTFFVEANPEHVQGNVILRTHTSSVQSRVMESTQPPIRIICPGRVYRNEAISYRAHAFFHQVEALYIDKNVSFTDLKQVLLLFAKEMFGAETQIRLRPSYFPFTEPSAEMDISCNICGGKGCPFCKGTGWVEILGCGMVDPNVLEANGIDSKVYSGYALGMGIERITNLKYRVNDLRLFSENDTRFLSMNFAEDHPARDMQDTFFVEANPEHVQGNVILRTHTSSVQSRVMESTQPPIRIICPGRVYRNEAISYRAHAFFHQVEALYIDKNVSFTDLKQVLLLFAKEMFGAETQIRLRPSYFPFTEPSAEMDISCNICGGKGCPFCKGTGWVEILGCGMVDPNVLEANGIDSKVYSGYALGMGIERITNLKYRVNDLRLFSENDTRFLKEFEAAN